jgi:hypothetical protein
VSAPENPSVPRYTTKPPRALTEAEREALHRIADALIPAVGDRPAPSQLRGYDGWLDRALAARDDAFERVVASAVRLAAREQRTLRVALKRFDADDPEGFHLLSSVLAGAYLMVPEVRRAIGYPGQRRHPPRFDEAADQIMDGILDPVIARGRFYTPATARRA